jgi:co-chaperonin GroES (HSP10)
VVREADEITLDVSRLVATTVSNGKVKLIIPIGGNIMCDEYYGKGATFTDVGGVKVFGELSKSGLITSIVKKASEKTAVVRIVGTPLKEDNMELSAGDLITFPNKFGFKNKIEDKEYLFIKYWDVHGIINETEI